MNIVIMMGRLTKDPEVRYSDSGTAFAKYSIAVDRRYKKEGQPTADFFNCTVFGKGAEFAEKYLQKGTKIVVNGRLENSSYTNKDGVTVYRTDVVVESQEFAESKNSASAADRHEEENRPKSIEEFMDASSLDDELPFS